MSDETCAERIERTCFCMLYIGHMYKLQIQSKEYTWSSVEKMIFHFMRDHLIFLAKIFFWTFFFFCNFYLFRLKILDEKKGQQPPYPQQNLPQTGFAPQPGFAQQPGFSASYPQSNFSSVYGDVVPPSNQHMPVSDEEPMVKGFEFSDMSIRRGFIRKVYSILSVSISFIISFTESLTRTHYVQMFHKHFHFNFRYNYC